MTAETVDRAPDRPTTASRSNRPFWIAIGVLLLLLIAAYLWKVASVSRSEDRARQAIEENTRSMLGLAAVPLGLSAREEAMSRNYGLMQERFERLLREPGVERVLYATANDSIAVSTDQSLIGQRLSTALPGEYGRSGGTDVVQEDGTYHTIVPITGLNERLGVVVLTYRGETLSPEEAADDPEAAGEEPAGEAP